MFKVETNKAHGTGENHCEKAAKAAPGTSPAEVMLKGMNIAAVKRLQLLFRNAHAIARNCRPFTVLIIVVFSWLEIKYEMSLLYFRIKAKALLYTMCLIFSSVIRIESIIN